MACGGNVDDVAAVRDLVGPDVELMLDCWMSLDVEYAVRLIEELRPFKLKWIEEALRSEDMDSHAELRRRVPWQTLATGEHWYTPVPFQHAASRRLVDVLQPDVMWVGGLTALACASAPSPTRRGWRSSHTPAPTNPTANTPATPCQAFPGANTS